MFERMEELLCDSIDEALLSCKVGDFVDVNVGEAAKILFNGLIEANPDKTCNECSLLVELFIADLSDGIEKRTFDDLLKSGYASRA